MRRIYNMKISFCSFDNHLFLGGYFIFYSNFVLNMFKKGKWDEDKKVIASGKRVPID